MEIALFFAADGSEFLELNCILNETSEITSCSSRSQCDSRGREIKEGQAMNANDESKKPGENKPAQVFGTQMPSFEPVIAPEATKTQPPAARVSDPPPKSKERRSAPVPDRPPQTPTGTIQVVKTAMGEVELPNPNAFRSVNKTISTEQGSLQKFATRLKAGQAQEASADESPKPGTKTTAGKSTWKLMIRQRSIQGDVSGVRNRIPTNSEEAVGFLSALVDNPEISEYEVLQEIGAGNMGVVYEALQTSLNRELAIKSLKPSAETSDYEQEMFVSEAVVTANLVHPNIVPIHDLGRTGDGKLFYSMKKVTGTPWDHLIRERPLEANLEVFLKVCDAVAYAHSRGVINRDLKPENVVVAAYGEVIVLDWGLAVTTDRFQKNESILQDFRGGAGTPVYMAPELISEDINAVDERTDIYLLGAILFEILEGFPPHLLRSFWHIEDANEQFTSIVHAVMTNQIEKEISHPGELMDIAIKAMSTNRDNRYESVEEFQEAIRQYRITGNAEEFYQRAMSDDASEEKQYDDFQSSIALFSEALQKWPANQRAEVGNMLARKGFAKLALERGDFDLGLHVIEGISGPDFDVTRKALKKNKSRRTLIKRTWSVMAGIVVVLAAFVIYQDAQADVVRQSLAELQEEQATIEKDLEEKNALVTSAQERIDKANKEAIAAQKIADDEKEAARVAKQNAESEIEKAQTEIAAAEMDAAKKIKKAEEDVAEKIRLAQMKADALIAANQEKLADVEMKLATADQKAQEAEVKAQQAEVALKDVQTRIVKSTIDAFRDRYNLYRQLGDHEQIAVLLEELDEELKETDNRALKLMRRAWQAQLRANQGRTFLHNLKPGLLQDAVVGRSGKVVAAVSRPESGLLLEIVFRNQAGGVVATQSVTLDEIDVRVDLSPDERFLTAVGGKTRRMWELAAGEIEEITLPTPSDKGNSTLSVRPRFSASGTHLFIASGNGGMTIDAYDLRESPLQTVSTFSYQKSKYSIFDFLPVRDRRVKDLFHVLVIGDQQGSRNCKYGKIQLSGGESRLNLDDIVNRALQERLKFLEISPGRELLAIGMGDNDVHFFPLSNRTNPFENVIENAEDQKYGSLHASSKVTSFAFSPEGKRVLVGLDLGLIEVWDWNESENSFVASTENELWQLQSKQVDNGKVANRIAGISQNPKALGFFEGSEDQVIAVGCIDSQSERLNSVIEWPLPKYSKYLENYSDVGTEIEKDAEKLLDSLDEPAEETVSLRDGPNPTSERNHLEPWDGNFFDLPVQFTAAPQETSEDVDKTYIEWRRRVAGSTQNARFSADGKRVLVAADDRAAHIFDPNNGGIMLSVGGKKSSFYENKSVFEEGHVPELAAIVFMPPSGDRLITRDFFGAISVWDSKDDENGVGREISRILSKDFGFAVSADGKWIFASDRGTRLNEQNKEVPTFLGHLWKSEALEMSVDPPPALKLENQHNQFITAAAFSPESTILATADRRGTIVVWDVMTGEALANLPGQHGRDQVSGLAFLNESEIISTGYDGTIQRWFLDRANGGNEEFPNVLTVANEKNSFSFPVTDEEEASEQTLAQLRQIGDYVIALAMSPNRKSFATLTVSKLTKEEIEKNIPDARPLEKRDAKWLRLTAWSIENPKKPVVLYESISTSRGSEFNQGLAWTNDGNHLAHLFTNERLSDESELVIYNSDDWTIDNRLRPQGMDKNSSRIAFAPTRDENGITRLATFDGRIARVWDLDRGEHLAEFRSHETVYGADFSADRKFVATVSDSIRVFDAEELSNNLGLTVFRMKSPHRGRVDAIQFSRVPGQYDFATLGGDGELKIWDWNPEVSMGPPDEPRVKIELDRGTRTIQGWQSSLDWSQSGKLLCATYGGKFSCYEIDGAKPVEITGLENPNSYEFYSCTISPSEELIAAGGAKLAADGRPQESFSAVWRRGEDGRFVLDGIFEGEHSSQANRGKVGTTAIHFLNEDDATILTGGADGSVLNWFWTGDGEPGILISSLTRPNSLQAEPAHEFPVTSIDVSAVGGIFSTGEDGYICRWAPRLD